MYKRGRCRKVWEPLCCSNSLNIKKKYFPPKKHNEKPAISDEINMLMTGYTHRLNKSNETNVTMTTHPAQQNKFAAENYISQMKLSLRRTTNV